MAVAVDIQRQRNQEAQQRLNAIRAEEAQHRIDFETATQQRLADYNKWNKDYIQRLREAEAVERATRIQAGAIQASGAQRKQALVNLAAARKTAAETGKSIKTAYRTNAIVAAEKAGSGGRTSKEFNPQEQETYRRQLKAGQSVKEAAQVAVMGRENVELYDALKAKGLDHNDAYKLTRDTSGVSQFELDAIRRQLNEGRPEGYPTDKEWAADIVKGNTKLQKIEGAGNKLSQPQIKKLLSLKGEAQDRYAKSIGIGASAVDKLVAENKPVEKPDTIRVPSGKGNEFVDVDRAYVEGLKKNYPGFYAILQSPAGLSKLNSAIDEYNAKIKVKRDALNKVANAGFISATSAGVLSSKTPPQFLYDFTGYNRQNPEDTKTLKAAGLTDAEIKKIKDYNEQPFVKITDIEKYHQAMEKAGAPYIGAQFERQLAEGLQPAYMIGSKEKRADLQKYNSVLENNPDLKQQFEDIFTGKPTQKALISVSAFTREYLAARGLADTKVGSTERTKALDEADAEYRRLYGKAAFTGSGFTEVAKILTPPARVLDPETKFRDIRGIEWAVGGAQAALLVMPAFEGLLTGALNTIAKSAINGGAGAVFTASTVQNWNEMSTPERVLSVGIDALLLGSAVTPAIKLSLIKNTTKSLNANLIKVKGEPLPAQQVKNLESALDDINKAIRSNSPGKLKIAANNLERAYKDIGIGGDTLNKQTMLMKANPELFIDNAKSAKLTGKNFRENLRILESVQKPAQEPIYRPASELRNVIEPEIPKGASKLTKAVNSRVSSVPESKGYKQLAKVDKLPKANLDGMGGTPLTPLEYKIYQQLGKKAYKPFGDNGPFFTRAERARIIARDLPNVAGRYGFKQAIRTYGIKATKVLYPELSNAALKAETQIANARGELARLAAERARLNANVVIERTIGSKLTASEQEWQNLIQKGLVEEPKTWDTKLVAYKGTPPQSIVKGIADTNPIIKQAEGGGWLLTPTEPNNTLPAPRYTKDAYLVSDVMLELSGYEKRFVGGELLDITKSTRQPVDIPPIESENPAKRVLETIKGNIKRDPFEEISYYQAKTVDGKLTGGTPKMRDISVELAGDTVNQQAANLANKIRNDVQKKGFLEVLKSYGNELVSDVYPYAFEYAIAENNSGGYYGNSTLSPSTSPVTTTTKPSAALTLELKTKGRVIPEITGTPGGSRADTGAKASTKTTVAVGTTLSGKSVTAQPGQKVSAVETALETPSARPLTVETTKSTPRISTTPSSARQPLSARSPKPSATPASQPVPTPVPTPVPEPTENVIETPEKPTPRLRTGTGTEEMEWTEKEIATAIAWKDGFIIHALKSPYRRGIDEASFHIGKAPEGLDVLNLMGAGSQEKSASLKGNLSRKLTVDVGNQDLIITPGRKGRVRFSFARDTRGTTSQLTIKRHSISRKKGRLYHTRVGGGDVISRRPLGGY